MTWTGLPDQAMTDAARAAVRVLPSPVAISATKPSCMAAAPMICTGYGRLPSVRRAASRTSAKARSNPPESSRPSRAVSRKSATSSANRCAPKSLTVCSSASTRCASARSRRSTGRRFFTHPTAALAVASRPFNSGAFTRRASKTPNNSVGAV